MTLTPDQQREKSIRELLGDNPSRITNGQDIAAVLRLLDAARVQVDDLLNQLEPYEKADDERRDAQEGYYSAMETAGF